ncbi:MAG: sensor histidine kinase [Thermoanaerobaculales bacterium]
MHERSAALLAAIVSLRVDAEGHVLLCSHDGKTSRCEVVPPLAEALATATSVRPARVTVRPAGGVSTAVTILTPPGPDGAVLAFDERSFDTLLSGSIERLVNQIAHDVRNHAFSIGLQAEMGARRSAAEAAVRPHFDAILRQVDSLKYYLEQLLLFGRPISLAPARVEVVGFLRALVQRFLFGRDRSAKAPSIHVEAEGVVPAAVWDADRIAQAISALLDNAVRSAAPPPPVVLAVRVLADGAALEVRDSGGGIAPDVMVKLAVPMAVRRAEGAGLGLAIARKVAEAHGGRLELESGPQGTTARLILPWEVTPA